MASEIKELKLKLSKHRVYELIEDTEALRIFMENHVIAVWDFMSLVKSLQASICGHSLPWIPPKHPMAARFINEIVLAEESDKVGNTFKSHFELYLDAMSELGCKLSGIRGVMTNVACRDHLSIESCLEGTALSSEAKRFALHTFSILAKPIHVQAAVFFHSRESIIPEMFTAIIRRLLQSGSPCTLLLDYLERHVETDGEIHGPLAQRLLHELCEGSSARMREGEEAAAGALKARLELWDSIAVAIETSHIQTQTANQLSTRFPYPLVS